VATGVAEFPVRALERLRALWRKVQYHPSKASLSWLLVGINVAIVVLVVAGISLSAIGLLRDLADEQGLARVQIAGAGAREELRKANEDLLTTTRELGQRPTLRRLLVERRPEALEQFLRRSCQSINATACAVMQGESVVGEFGPQIPWSDVLAAAGEQGERFMAAPATLAQPVMGAVAPVGVEQGAMAQADTRVLVIRFMDESLASSLSDRVGLVVRLVNYRWFSSAPTDAFTRLHSAGLSDGRFAAERIKAFDVFAASFPIFASTGEAIVLLETRLPTAEIDASVRHLVNRLLITALVLVALAVLVSFILGQQVAGPVRALTDAALRLGQGDFSTSIPTAGTAEVVALSRTMEDMRRNLIDLTTTLRLREAEAQAVLQGIVEGVYAVDKSRTIRYLNPQAAKLLNVRAEDVIGRFCGDVLKPRSVHGVLPCDARCPILEARNSGSAQATEHLMPTSGAPRTAIITSSSIVDGLQVQVIRDETELEAVRRARDTVLANISHEFRTPLAAQLASIELLRDGLDTMSAEQRRELVRSLERGTYRLTALIDNLLESVRIESGQLSIRKQSIDLRESVNDAQELIGSLLTQRNQELRVQFAEELPDIEGDGPRLVQVFVNLLANASKFAPEGSVLRVGADVTGDVVTAWVEDEGPGVPEMQSGSIFDRFHRGPDQEPEPGGLGLGLWIVKSIVERHGGTISAARTAENRTRFSFTLPVAREGE